MDDIEVRPYESQLYWNTLRDMPYLPYLCTTYLAENNEMIWKLLYDNGRDAWNIDDIDIEDKIDMIYKGMPPESNYKVFFDEGQVDAWTHQVTMLRIMPIMIEPVNHVHAHLYLSFEVLSHYDINHMSNYCTRVDTIIQQLVETLNGKDIEGVGVLIFDNSSYSGCQIISSGQKPYSGKCLIMAVDYCSTDNE